MNKSVIGGIVAVVVIGGALVANNVMNTKAEEAVSKFIVNANQESDNHFGKLTSNDVTCSVLFSDSCTFNGLKFENYDTPEQSFDIEKLTVSGIKSYIGNIDNKSAKNIFPLGDTEIGVKMEGIRSLDGQTLNDMIASESPKFYSALTDDIKKELADNNFYIEAHVQNTVTSSSLTSDDDVTLRFNQLPLSFKSQIKYTYNGDLSIFRDPKAIMNNRSDIFGILGNLTLNNASVSVEQGQYMFTDVFYGFYKNHIDNCANADLCIARSNRAFPEPYNKYDKLLSKTEFEAALVNVVESKKGDIYQQFQRMTRHSLFTPDELHQLVEFMVKGDRAMTLRFVNKNNLPMLGFADVISHGMTSLRDKVNIEIK